MKISPYTIYLKMQPNALLIRQNFIICKKWVLQMYHDLRQQFWWIRMKRKAARYVSECDTYRKVKADYMKPGGLLQPLSILE
jgi:hypothetical protein